MNMKKIIAGAVASVMAVSTMAIAASAVDINKKFQGAVGGGKYDGAITFEEELKNVDGTKVVKVEMEIEVDSGFCNGFMGANDPDGNWYATDQIDTNGTSDTWTWECDKGIDVESFKVEFWWINPVTPEGAEQSEEDPAGTVTIKTIKFLDKDGNDLAAASSDPGTDDPSTDDPTTPPATGVEGVAVVVGLAVLATGALVVAKKRK